MVEYSSGRWWSIGISGGVPQWWTIVPVSPGVVSNSKRGGSKQGPPAVLATRPKEQPAQDVVPFPPGEVHYSW